MKASAVLPRHDTPPQIISPPDPREWREYSWSSSLLSAQWYAKPSGPPRHHLFSLIKVTHRQKAASLVTISRAHFSRARRWSNVKNRRHFILWYSVYCAFCKMRRTVRTETLIPRRVTTWSALKRSFEAVLTIILSIVGDKLDGLPAVFVVTFSFTILITFNTAVLERDNWAAIALWLSFTSLRASTVDFSSLDNARPCSMFVSS